MYNEIKRLLIGQPLSSQMQAHERIPKWKALAVLSSDALSSVAYATEEILIPLAAFATAAIVWSIPIACCIALLLIIITVSYRQTIKAYPNGGGAYVVARENLGVNAGLVAGSALIIDYILTVSVSVAAGVANIGAAIPFFHLHREAMSILAVILIMLVNLRGVRESANIFAMPTYFFIGSMVLMLGVGFWQWFQGMPIVAPAPALAASGWQAVPLFLLLRAFSSGCAALTGVEAISNGVGIFRPPAPHNARVTMAVMTSILGIFFLGITTLTYHYGIQPQEGQTTIAMLAERVFSGSWLYYLIPLSTALILLLAANTSYSDFPRVCSLIAQDGFLPRQLNSLGDRLVYSNGIVTLSFCAILLLVIFEADTHQLIPLYAVGVFLSFTLSQTGMVRHHLRHRQPGMIWSIAINGLGALATFIVLVVIACSKFMHGAWLVVVILPLMIWVFQLIRKHYTHVHAQLALNVSNRPSLQPIQHTVIVPISNIHRGVVDALRYAMSISSDVRACYVELDPAATAQFKEQWNQLGIEIPFVVLKSPYRSIIGPLLRYIDEIDQISHNYLTVVIPEFVTSRWWHRILHNQTALMIRTALKWRRRKVVTSVRYHLDD